MAEITHIKIDNSLYKFTDADAAKKTGDTFTGNITINKSGPSLQLIDPRIAIHDTPESNIDDTLMILRDVDNDWLARIICSKKSAADDGKVTVGMYTYNRDQDSGQDNRVSNGMSFGVSATGVRTASFSDPKCVRVGLGADEDGTWPLSVGGIGGKDNGLKSFTNDSVFTGGPIQYRRVGHWVELRANYIQLVSNLTAASVNLGTLPEEIRPQGSTNPNKIYIPAGSSAYDHGMDGCIIFNQSGEINYYKPHAIATWTTSMTFSFHVMYFVF